MLEVLLPLLAAHIMHTLSLLSKHALAASHLILFPLFMHVTYFGSTCRPNLKQALDAFHYLCIANSFHPEQVNWSDFRAFFRKRSLGIEKAFRTFDVDGGLNL